MAILQSDSIYSFHILTCKANENTTRKSKIKLVDLVSSEQLLQQGLMIIYNLHILGILQLSD
jgi:hypothetical protein